MIKRLLHKVFLNHYNQWKSQIRMIGNDKNYIRFTPNFGFRFELFGKVFKWSIHYGWTKERNINGTIINTPSKRSRYNKKLKMVK